MHGTSTSTRRGKSPASKVTLSPQVAEQIGADRSNDVLLTFEEVCELTRTNAATWRWKRHRREAPFLWRSGRRLVAWKSDVLAHLEAQRLADLAEQADTR